MNKDNTCCMLGKRNIPAADLLLLKQNLSCTLEQLIQNGVTRFILGGADEGCRLAADVLQTLALRYPQIRLSLMLPCPGYGWLTGDIKTLWHIALLSDSITYTFPRYHPFPHRTHLRKLLSAGSHLLPLSPSRSLKKRAQKAGVATHLFENTPFLQ